MLMIRSPTTSSISKYARTDVAAKLRWLQADDPRDLTRHYLRRRRCELQRRLEIGEIEQPVGCKCIHQRHACASWDRASRRSFGQHSNASIEAAHLAEPSCLSRRADG